MLAATSPRIPDREVADSTADLELRALEKMICARCEQIRLCTERVTTCGRLSRECDLQLQVFAERSTIARRELGTVSTEPAEIRIARLEAIVQALECSWDYFRELFDAAFDDSARRRVAYAR